MFLVFFEVIWYIKIQKWGFPGVQNPEIMEFEGFGPSHNKTEFWLDQNEPEWFPGTFKPII